MLMLCISRDQRRGQGQPSVTGLGQGGEGEGWTGGRGGQTDIHRMTLGEIYGLTLGIVAYRSF